MANDFLSRSRLLLASIEKSSINRAAQDFGMGAPQASRELSQLESELGVKLLERFPTGVRASEAGVRFAEAMTPLIEKLNEIEATLLQGSRGEASLSLPVSAGTELFPRWISEFRALHPGTNLAVGVRREGEAAAAGSSSFKIVVQRVPSEESLVAIRLCDVPLVCAASPEYLLEAGDVLSPQELPAHRLLYSSAETELPLSLTERSTGRIYNLEASRMADAGLQLALRSRAKEGEGIALAIPRYLVAGELRRRELVEVLPGWEIEPEVMWLMRPQSRFPSLLGQQLVAWLRQCAGKNPSLRV